jgi:cytochrome c-type biogenesis protein CcmH
VSGFIAVAGLLTLAVLVALLYPLLRRREGSPEAWRSGGIAALLLAIGASALYPLWSNFNWHASEPALDSPQAMVGRLARRLEKQPDDLAGWLQLGRSYTVLEEFPLAIRAYERANTLAKGQSPEAAMGLAEALFDGGRSDLAGRSGRLFEQALALDPNSTKALFYSALAAGERNEIALAKERFARILAANPPANVRTMIEEQVKALDATAKMAAAAPAAASGAAAAGPVVTVPLHITLGAKLGAKPVPAGARLFVMARSPGQGGPPLAVQLLEPKFPQDVELHSSDAVMGGTGFKAGQDLEIEARIAYGGGANSQSGDAFGTVRLKAGSGSRTSIEIDQLKP